MSSQEQSGGPVMAFGDHLEELRRRLLFALAPIIPVFVLLFLGWQLVLTLDLVAILAFHRPRSLCPGKTLHPFGDPTVGPADHHWDDLFASHHVASAF